MIKETYSSLQKNTSATIKKYSLPIKFFSAGILCSAISYFSSVESKNVSYQLNNLPTEISSSYHQLCDLEKNLHSYKKLETYSDSLQKKDNLKKFLEKTTPSYTVIQSLEEQQESSNHNKTLFTSFALVCFITASIKAFSKEKNE